MDSLTVNDITVILAIATGGLGIWAAINKSKKDSADNATRFTKLETNMEAKFDHVIEGINGLRIDLKDNRHDIDLLKERVTRIEEVARSCHKRVDILEGKDARPN